MNTSDLPARRIQLNQKSRHWGGLAFAFGSVLFIVNKLDEMSRVFLARPMPDLISGQQIGLILLGQMALIMGYVAYYRCYAPRVGRFGKIALGLLSGGGMLLALGHVTFMSGLGEQLPRSLAQYGENLFVLVIFGLLFLLIGLIWFGILTLRKPLLRCWQWLPLATGLMGFIGFFAFSGEIITAPFLFFRTLFAIGLIGLGIILWLEQPMQPNTVT